MQELENIERQPNYEEYKRRYDYAKKYLMYKTSYLELIQTVGNRHFTSDENELLKIGSKVFWGFGEDSEEVRKPFIEELLDKYDSEELDNLSSEMERIWRGDNNGYLDEYNSQIKKYNRRLQKGKRRRKRKKS